MVVNPQTFNYRLIIGTLIVAIIALGTYSYSSYNKLKDQKEFLVQEKQIVENEISKIISRYDTLMFENQTIKFQLDSAKQRTLKVLDSFRLQEASIYLISKYREQIQTLNNERSQLLKLANSLKTENSELKQDKVVVGRQLKEQTEHNTSLSETNLLLAENLKKGSVLTANSFSAQAFKTRASGKLIETNRAKRTDVMEVCFTLAENALAESGSKDLYIQIIGPNSNIIGDKLSKAFGEYTLIYSSKLNVDYANEVLDICVKAQAGEEEKVFTKGTYYVNVFHNEIKLGSTKIVLN